MPVLLRLNKFISHLFNPVKPWLRRANVVMFHDGRVGSTVVGDLLNQHPCMLWGSEVYWEESKRFWLSPDPAHYQPIHCPYRVMSREMRRAGRRIFGAEIRHEHLAMYGLTLEHFLPWLRRRHFTHFIVLWRKNILRQVVSSRIVVQRGDFWRQVQGQPTQLTRLNLDVNDLRYLGRSYRLPDLIAHYQATTQKAIRVLSGQRLLTLIYEDDVEPDPRLAYRKACAFLGLEPTEPTIRDTRMNPFPLRDILENYDEVASLLQPTPYAWMLDS